MRERKDVMINEKVKMPSRYVRLGGRFRRYGVELVCVERPEGLSPCDACRGCFFCSSRINGVVINCNDIQCSSWDRMDGVNVWFREV